MSTVADLHSLVRRINRYDPGIGKIILECIAPCGVWPPALPCENKSCQNEIQPRDLWFSVYYQKWLPTHHRNFYYCTLGIPNVLGSRTSAFCADPRCIAWKDREITAFRRHPDICCEHCGNYSMCHCDYFD